MSAMDKEHLMEALKLKGWEEAADRFGAYHLRPPAHLLERLARMTFYVYDARDLQDLSETTSEPVSKTDELPAGVGRVE